MLSVDKYIKCIFPDLHVITVFHQLVMNFLLVATDSGPLYMVCFTVVKTYFYLKLVDSWRYT